MSPEEVREWMKAMKTRQSSPQTFQATLREEAVVLEKKVSKKKQSVQKLLSDLD